MRIALVHNMPIGGAKVSAYEFARELSKLHTVDVYEVVIEETNFYNMEEVAHKVYKFPFTVIPYFSGKLWRINFIIDFINYIRIDILYRKIASRINHKSYDIVFTHQCVLTFEPPIIYYLRGIVVHYCQTPVPKFYKKL